MADDRHIRPPWWLKPLNKVFMAVMRLGLPISGKEAPMVLTVPGASRATRARRRSRRCTSTTNATS